MRLVRPVPVRNFRTAILYSSVRSLVGLALLVGGTFAVGTLTGGTATMASEAVQSSDVSTLDTSADPVADLIAAHGCWTQDGPAGVIPGHVVYDGRYLGSRATGQALDAVFGKSSRLDPSLVQAFCR